MSINQNLVVDLPASMRITSRSSKGQTALRGLLPNPDLDRSLTQRVGQVSDLGLELFLTRRRTGPPGRQRGLTGLQEVGLPTADRLLADLLPPRRLSNAELAGDHAQHDPGLLLRRDHWGWSTHVTDSFRNNSIVLPQSLTRDKITAAAQSPGGRSTILSPERALRQGHFG